MNQHHRQEIKNTNGICMIKSGWMGPVNTGSRGTSGSFSVKEGVPSGGESKGSAIGEARI